MSGRNGIITGMSVSHADASLDELHTATLECPEQTLATLLANEQVTEAVVLQTCNRVEAYVVTDTAEDGQEVLEPLFADVPAAVRSELGHEESLEHLLRVAAGLESLVLGEDQILGQVRDAHEQAHRMDGIGPVLGDALLKAIRVGERARTETAINEGVVSLASAAVRLAAEVHGLEGATAAVIGTGEMGRLAAKHFAPEVTTLRLVNRTVSRADELAKVLDERQAHIETAGFETVPETVDAADIVISATGSQTPIIETGTLETVSETLIIDITRPRDIPEEADELPQIELYDLDKLEAVTEKTRQMRQEAAIAVEEIVDEEFSHLLTQYKRKQADQVISAMYESAERVKAKELKQAFQSAEFDDEQQAVVAAMADALVSQLLSTPTNSLRDAAEDDDWTTIHTALQLFDPSIGPDSESIPPVLLNRLGADEIPGPLQERFEQVDD